MAIVYIKFMSLNVLQDGCMVRGIQILGPSVTAAGPLSCLWEICSFMNENSGTIAHPFFPYIKKKSNRVINLIEIKCSRDMTLIFRAKQRLFC